ncbi:MAG: CoA pyrophosphatase [Nocardioidaceae bacterium]|nr:CoA pyrophosphatase [Nocardioidaceae bacterium]NUS51844.1 CoA pyrophosphatase [Nocardioidaceae bacterium]
MPDDPALPDWLEPVRRAAAEIGAEDLTRFVPPEDSSTRQGAVLLLFGDGPAGHDLLLTERAHDMRSHPGQVSFPGGSVDGDETAEDTALREAREETGLDPAGVDVFATLPQLWLPPSNFAVTPVLGWWRTESDVTVVDPREVHAVYRVPLDELLDPAHRVSVRHPSGWKGPAFLIGDDKDLLLWGFTAGIIARLFDFLGWTRPWDPEVMRDLPEHMLAATQQARRDEGRRA